LEELLVELQQALLIPVAVVVVLVGIIVPVLMLEQ
jgi:hypothetical protein